MIRVAIADPFKIPRWALHQALKGLGFDIVGEAGTPPETIEMLRTVKPEVLIVDTTMPDHTGFDVLAAARQLEGGPLLVVCAPHDDASYAARAITAGAHAYVSKSDDPQALIHAIHAVVRGERAVPADVEKLLAGSGGHPASALTHREQQVMELLARGMTNREIAVHFEISVKTVDTHRGHLLKKLSLRNNSDLTRFAVKHGYATL